MVRRSSRVSRKSRSKVNRKMNRSRKVSRRVNKSRKVSRRVNKSRRMNKSRRVTNKRTKRVNKSRRISRKRTKRVNNKRTKRTKRVSRKRTREIEGGMMDRLMGRPLKKEIPSPVRTDSPPASPLSESGLSEIDQKLEVNEIIERYGKTDKSNEHLKSAIAEFKGFNITDEESIDAFRTKVMQPAITKMKEEIENGELTFEQASIDFLSLEIDERTASSKDFMNFINAQQVKREIEKKMELQNPQQITPTDPQKPEESTDARKKPEESTRSPVVSFRDLKEEKERERRPEKEKLMSDTEEQIDKVTEVYSSRRGHVFKTRMETLVELLSLAKESVKSEQYQKSTTEYEKAKKVLFEIVIKPLILFILDVKKYDKKFRKKMFEEYSSKTYYELLDMARNSINELIVLKENLLDSGELRPVAEEKATAEQAYKEAVEKETAAAELKEAAVTTLNEVEEQVKEQKNTKIGKVAVGLKIMKNETLKEAEEAAKKSQSEAEVADGAAAAAEKAVAAASARYEIIETKVRLERKKIQEKESELLDELEKLEADLNEVELFKKIAELETKSMELHEKLKKDNADAYKEFKDQQTEQ